MLSCLVPTASDRQEFEFLLETARAARARKLDQFLHLAQPVGIWNYIRIANEIAAAVPRGRMLDWGCGLGQMTWLLQRRHFDVTAFDVGAADTTLPDLPLTRDLRVIRTTHPTKLPFDDGSFDVVLSCGVLEHVDELSQPGNEVISLYEIHRVLRPAGWFAIYQLPQRHAWQEAVNRRLGVGYSHPRRFTAREIRTLLARTGFDVRRLRRNNMFPKNLTGMPESVRTLYSRVARGIIGLDRVVSRTPGLNRIAGVLEVIAQRTP
jgi:SAM-dependent methyltransferase